MMTKERRGWFGGRRRELGGFALVVTISLMVLLMVLGVGLLSLSAVVLRAGGVTAAREEAMSNARLAMMLALGELQRAAGPDQRVTGPAKLRHETSHPALTGVWRSFESTTTRRPDGESRWQAGAAGEVAEGGFVGWLASPAVAVGGKAADPLVPPRSGASAKAVRMLGTAGEPLRLEPTPAGPRGAVAWAVVDEGVKARIDLPKEAVRKDRDERFARLRAPGRQAAEVIAEDTAGLVFDRETAAKVVSVQQAEIPGGPKVGEYHDDLTTWSAALPVNVAAGGLKADLTRAFESAKLPAELQGRFVYANSSKRLATADPLFSNLAAYYKLYQETAGGTKPLQVTLPNRYTPLSGTRINLAPLDGNLIAPVVSRVSVVFSLIGHEAHGHWIDTIPSQSGDPQRTYMVYLIYTPVVTVHNPWTVPLTFKDLKVTFKNLPIGFKFFRSGTAQTNTLGLLSQFHVSSQTMSGFDDPFSVTLSNRPGSKSDTSITLKPGEARVFGVNWPKGTKWGNMTNYLWQNDLDKSKTLDITAGPGWDYRTGFIVDWLHPQAAGPTTDARTGVFGVRNTDTIDVECGPVIPSNANGRFSIEVEVLANRRPTKIGAYEYVYGTERRLREALENGTNPALGKVRFPFRPERPWAFNKLYQPGYEGTPVEAWSGAKQFAVFTLIDRTAQDALYGTKPVRHSSFAHQVLSMDITRTHPAQMPMELSLLPIRGEGANVVGSIDADVNDRAYFFSGTRALTGALSFPTYQVPVSPVVNLASFSHANLASSGHLPLTSYTVGESLAPASVPPDQVVAGGLFGYESLDHSWLANNTLWDGYYLSGVRSSDEAKGFFNHQPLALNPRFAPVLPAGRGPSEAADAVMADDGWTKLAGMQLVKGAFNVNSTSVHAWKALLASLGGAEIPVIDPLTAAPRDQTGGAAPFPRLLQPVAGSIDAAGKPDNQTRWAGFRDLDDKELAALAEEIVGQVRARGPFLSMSEFVNRRPGAGTEETSTAGALEAAIRKAGINNIPAGPVTRAVTEAEAKTFGYANPQAAAGDVEEGANAFLTQGDLLAALGSFLTVRSDTFTIRAYGDARDPAGNVTARAWCEAVVQRMPAFVDPGDAPDKVQVAANRLPDSLKPVNRTFGRRFEVVAFRWLAPDEV